MSKQTTTSRKGHPGVNRLTRSCHGRWKKHRTKYQYDTLNRLTSLVWKTNGIVISSFGYTLGLTGNRIALAETNGSAVRNYHWTNDALYRLTNETVTGSAPTGTLAYGYDAVGNRTVRTNLVSGLGLTNQMLAYNTNDWLTGDLYDNNGDTANSGGNYYQYDVMGHLTVMTNSTVQITNIYDGDGNRVGKTVVVGGTTTLTYYLIDDRNPSGYPQVMEEWTSTDGTNQAFNVYNYGLNLISQQQVSAWPYDETTNVIYYGFDGHGSVRFLTDTNATITDTYTYDAYGSLIAVSGSTSNNRLYCGMQWDSDLNLYYDNARYLNTGTGRFWTADSVDGNNEDPLSLHKYLYGADNPVNEIDPLGQSFFGFDGTGNSPTANLSNIRKMWFGSTDPDKHYEVGVGTAWGTRTFAGATGLGMARRESKAMGELIADRTKGDTVVDIVGFSRGGIEATEFANRVADAFPDETIRFVGLFDPVGSVGHPGGFGSYRSQLPSSVQYSVEAMAANENRSFFPATDVNVNLQQWFRGTHSDIGGGWPNHQLSDYVLQWMIQQAQSKGVGINLSAIQAKYGWDPDPNAAIDSNQGFTSWFTTGSVRNVLSATGGGYTVSPSDMGF